MRHLFLSLACVLAGAAAPGHALPLEPCRLPGVETAARCGVVRRPLDPAAPAGPSIDVHFAVIPALARQRKPDPVFFLAGGPGQSAIQLAGSVQALLGRLGNRRDLVLVDQRGTGRSALLACEEGAAASRPLADLLDDARQQQVLRECRQALQTLPHGDLRRFTTSVAMQDLEAVRQVLGTEHINLVGGSYGTRAALEYMRQQPDRVRRAVLDGVAPPDMALPAAMSTDAQAALEQVLAGCEREPGCAARFPGLRSHWQQLLRSLPREVDLPHPMTGRAERVTLTRDAVLSLVRGVLYQPALAAALPGAIVDAAQGRFAPLSGLASAMMGRGGAAQIAQGMHFSVVCAEDEPLLASSRDAQAPDFGRATAELYRRVCADWPRAAVPEAFYRMPQARGATLLLSGGADPVTPPRHGERAAQALGSKARHVVVAQAGHGVMALPCVRDLLFRFIDAPDDAQALAVDATCVAQVPRPRPYLPLAGGSRP